LFLSTSLLSLYFISELQLDLRVLGAGYVGLGAALRRAV